MKARQTLISYVAFPVLLILLLAGLTYANFSFALMAPGGNDFLPRYLGTRAWILEGTSPYDPSISAEAQQVIYGRPANPEAGEDVAHFVYPLPVVLFIAPFSLFPYPLARALWMTTLEVLLPLLFIIGLRLTSWRPGRWFLGGLMLFSILWYFGFRAMILGQFAVVEAVLVAAALWMIRQERDIAAGILLALSIAKPQVPFLLIPWVVIWAASRRRWTLAISTVGAIGGLIVGFMAVIPDWPLQWIYQVLEYPSYSPESSPVKIIADALPAASSIVVVLLSVGLLVYLLAEWWLGYGEGERHFQWTAAMTLTIGQLVLFRTSSTNFLVLGPALILFLSIVIERWGRVGRAWAAAALIGLVVLPWALFLTTLVGDQEHSVMLLTMPLIMLVSLWWVRWWAVHAPLVALTAQAPPTGRPGSRSV
ncbi:MAG: glycosyltransferase family 87 protein [Anaerolineales bacterium]